MAAIAEFNIETTTAKLSHDEAFKRVLARGLEIETVLDLGAANGSWSLGMKHKLLPKARFHLLEAQPRWLPDLDSVTSLEADFSYSHAAIAQKDGECFFDVPTDNPYGGRAYETETKNDLISVKAVSVDGEVERHNLKGPFMLKFDIHGLEDKVLRGASRTLRETNLIVMEMLNYADDGRYFPYLLNLLNSLGFRCVDIAEPMFRPKDDAFWQIDMFFVKNTRPEASYSGFY